MTRFTKILVVLFVFSVMVCGSVFASGGTESIAVRSKANLGVIEKIISGIGTKLSNMTTTLIYNLHPYPNIMSKFYNLKAVGDVEVSSIEARDVYSNDFESDSLLIADSYYSSERAGKINDVKENLYLHTANAEKQQKRWSLTASLFAMVFAAEVAFTAVMGYVAPQQEGMSLLKELGAKAAKTFLLFILAASLPFLIEGVRYGLFSIANTYSASSEENGIQMTTMFEMPEQFMTNMAYLVEEISWRGDASPIFNDESGTLSSSLLGRLLAGFIYVFFEIFICMEIIKAGMHILMNIVEVYLLLSCVMILLPFTIFTPSKEMVRGCATSLFMNLIECFVLCLIVIIVVPACLNMAKDLSALAGATSMADMYHITLLSKEISTKDTKDVKSGAEINYELDVTISSSNIIAVITWDYEGEKKGASTVETLTNQNSMIVAFDWEEDDAQYYWNSVKAYDKPGWTRIYHDKIEAYFFDYNNGRYPTAEDRLVYAGNNKEGTWIISHSSTKYAYKDLSSDMTLDEYCRNTSYCILSSLSFYSLFDFLVDYWANWPEARSNSDDVDALKTLLKSQNKIKKAMEQYNSTMDMNWRGIAAKSIRQNCKMIMMNNGAAEADKTNKTAANDGLIANMIIAWIIIFIPCYFVKQSSQITMGLQRGGVGMESFSNALNAGTAAMKTGFQMTANVMKTAISGANAVHSASAATKNAAALKSITEHLQSASNPGDNAAGNSGSSTTPS